VSSLPTSVVKPSASWKAMLECASVEVFELMANIHLEPWASSTDEPGGDMMAMVGLGGALCGMMIVRCSSKSAKNIASRMLGGDSEPTEPTISDALGEICNMVAGNFKAKITGLADGCMLSVPTVISGDDYTMRAVSADNCFQSALSLDGEPIWVSLLVHS
jgi:chemotaxis protein CheX